MFEALHNVYPLLVAAAFAAAVIPVAGLKIDSPEKIPYMARAISESSILLATFISLVGSTLALWYVGQNVQWLIDGAYLLIVVAYILLLISFVFPLLIMIIHPFWRSLYYLPFEEAQEKDLEEVLTIEKDEDNVAPPDSPSTHNASAHQEKPKP